jgi:hypothetical protein
MKSTFFRVVLLGFVVVVPFIIAGLPSSNSAKQVSTGTISGADNPQLIPDHSAYIVLFRLIANRQTEEEKRRIRAYIRQAGLGKQSCEKYPSTGIGDADIDGLIAAAEEFQRRVGVLDLQAKEIRNNNRNSPSTETVSRLKQLQEQKEKITDEIIASLGKYMSPEGVKQLQVHINSHVKAHMKFNRAVNIQ